MPNRNGLLSPEEMNEAGVRDLFGTPIYPVPPSINNDALIYRPEATSKADGGLLEADALQRLRNNFAGGLFAGAQYDPYRNIYAAVKPSGVYMTDDEMNEPGEADPFEGAGDGAFTLSDLMEFQTAIGQANFGNQDPMSAFSMFEDKGRGTYDIKAGSPYSNLLFGTDSYGERVPLNMAVDKNGEQLDPQLVRNRIKASFAGIDESR